MVVTCLAVLAAPGLTRPAGAYSWPLKPFHKPHAIRGAFDDPRFHLGAESELSAFHFGVDIVAKDGAPVYAVEPGYVHARRTDLTVTTRTGRDFGYWHVRPVVRTGRRVRLHQLIGHVIAGWGHVHFAEAVHGSYRNPLRHGALSPYPDHTPPTVGAIRIFPSGSTSLSVTRVSSSIDIEAEVYDTPPIPPPGTWHVARLTPALIWWKLLRGNQALTDWNLSVDFSFALMPGSLYNWIYAPGTYQNKANRPGEYLFWLVHGLDTRQFPDGNYRIAVLAEDTRWNVGSGTLDFTIANGAPPITPVLAPGMASPFRRPV